MNSLVFKKPLLRLISSRHDIHPTTYKQSHTSKTNKNAPRLCSKHRQALNPKKLMYDICHIMGVFVIPSQNVLAHSLAHLLFLKLSEIIIQFLCTAKSSGELLALIFVGFFMFFSLTFLS